MFQNIGSMFGGLLSPPWLPIQFTACEDLCIFLVENYSDKGQHAREQTKPVEEVGDSIMGCHLCDQNPGLEEVCTHYQ